MMNTIRENYEQYCLDKRELREAPLPYINWLEAELEAYMEFYSKKKECEHKNVRFDRESDAYFARQEIYTHYHLCPDCDELIEGETEGGT